MIAAGLVWLVVDPLTYLLTSLVRSVLWCSIFFSVAYSLGWVQRLLWFLLEKTASDLWNGTPVTIGSLEIDIIRGRVWATNVVIHTPKREEWQWESPLIARIGRVYVEHNWISSFLTMCFQVVCGQEQKQILEIYSIEVSDIQGFIERKQHIFNFYLMDPWLDLPDPKDILLEEEKDLRRKQTAQPGQAQARNQQQSSNNTEETKNNHDNLSEVSVDLSINPYQVEAAFTSELHQARNNNHESSSTFIADVGKDDLLEGGEDDDIVHRQAQQLVDDMFSAVKSIGRAKRQKGALDGGSIAAQLASKLKQFKGTKNKSEAMQEGVKVIQRVGKAVAKKTKDMKNVMPKMPNRREPDVAPVYARVGRIVIEDAKVFTRTNTNASVVAPNNNAASTATTTKLESNKQTPTRQAQDGRGKSEAKQSASTAMSSHGLGAKWNKPIGISEIVLRPSELCPPNSLLDDNGLPAIYQPLDKIVDVVVKRALVGLAERNTSRFLHTALGELLEMEYNTIFGDNGGSKAVSPTSAGRPYRRANTIGSVPNM